MTALVLSIAGRLESVAMSDEALVRACAAGDEGALALLFERHSRSVYRYISRMNGAERGEVEDLAQAVFIEVWRVARRFRGTSSVRVWIIGIAHNVTRTALRGRRRRHAAVERLAAVPNAKPRAIDQQAADSVFVGRFADALGSLSEGQQSAFILCELEEMTAAEAAIVLDARPGTVGRWVAEARKLLRSRLEDPR